MSKQKAMEFLKFLEANKEFQEKMSGFTPEELAEASKEMYGELSDRDLGSVAGGKPNPGSGRDARISVHSMLYKSKMIDLG
jgi:hypothetical protein